jgi:hypothetical protein
MALYMTCALCGRKQAEGLLSRGYWGHVDAGVSGTLRCCPICKESHAANWQTRVLATLDGRGAAVTEPAHEAGQSSLT